MLDESDTVLWSSLATSVLMIDPLELQHLITARQAFEHILEVNESHWPSIEKLCVVSI